MDFGSSTVIDEEWNPYITRASAGDAGGPTSGQGYADFNTTLTDAGFTLYTQAPTNGTLLSAITPSPRHAMIYAFTQAVNWTSDTTAPSTTKGQQIAANGVLKLVNSPNIIKNLKFISAVAGGNVRIEYYF